MGWLSGWAYRRPVRIDNSQNPNNLTYYQVLVTVDTAFLIAQGKMRSDCGDIRFTDSDGVTLLPYWIESGINTSTTKIWVKVPSIPASSFYTIYMYYGNPSALPASDENLVFDYVDRGDKFNTWTQGTYACSQDTSIGNPPPSYKAPSGKGYYMYKNIGLAPGMIIIFNVRTNALGNLFFLVDANGAGQMYRLDSRGGTNYSGFATTTNWTTWGIPSSGFNAAANTWYKLTIVITSSTSAKLYYSQTTDASPQSGTFGTLLGTYTISNNGPYIGLVGDAYGTSYYTWWDNIIVRKYTDPEPTTAILTEETPPPPAVFTPIDELKKRLIFTTTPSFLKLSGSGSLNILSPSAGTKTLTVRNWWLITNATDGRITLASPSKLFGSLLAKKQKKTGQEDIWTTLGMGEPILLYYQGITPDSKVLVLVSWRED